MNSNSTTGSTQLNLGRRLLIYARFFGFERNLLHAPATCHPPLAHCSAIPAQPSEGLWRILSLTHPSPAGLQL